MIIQKIMIVDDDPDLVDLMIKRIETCGVECHGFTSVEGALRGVKRLKPDLVFLTQEYAETTGIDFLYHMDRMLAQDEKGPHVIVLNDENDQSYIEYASDFDGPVFRGDQCASVSLEKMLADNLPIEQELML